LLAADEPRRLDQPLRVRRRLKIRDVARRAQAGQQKAVRRDFRRLSGVLRDVPGSPPDVVLREANYLELPAPANALAAGGHLYRLDGAVDHALEQLRSAATRWHSADVARAVEPNDPVVVD